MAALSETDVRKIALLARLDLTPSEEQRFGAQLSAVLDHVKQMAELKLDGVAPTTHPTAARETSMRADVVQPSLPAAKAVAAAPQKSGTAFVVPRILGES